MLEDLKKNPAAVDPDAESLARLKALRGEPAQQPAPPKIPFPVAQVTGSWALLNTFVCTSAQPLRCPVLCGQKQYL